MKTYQKGIASMTFVIVIVAILVSAVGYFAFVKKSEQTERWRTFTNTKYGYSFQYPETLRGPVSHCGGVGIDIVEPAEICNEVGINTEPATNPYWNPAFDDSIIIRVLDNSERASMEELNDGKTAVLFVPIENNEIIRVTYPVKFCFVVKGTSEPDKLMRFTSPCYSDDRNELYKQIVSTLLVSR